jgi:hypothetical protein
MQIKSDNLLMIQTYISIITYVYFRQEQYKRFIVLNVFTNVTSKLYSDGRISG